MATSFSLSNLLSFPLPSSSSLLHKHPPQPKLLVPNSLPLKSKSNSLGVTCGFLSAELGSAICGGHASTTVHCSSQYNVEVYVEDEEPDERDLSQFTREVLRAGILQEVSRRRHYENAAEKKKRKRKEAARRDKRRRNPQRFNPNFPGDDDEVEVGEKEEEDNWELPEEDITF
ncbi:hypothetical protein Tsubulata_000656 [Turnera subulata]|uniref:30S ribosomal protein S21, chloroplastic n=1 Tax=Turnera subulata TaxID=218843 RepID=A0A9Q0FI48_9ROSI|nr:hypothetical protein Tsubulata_000656 [Turnera subulata]